ncbi:MAG: 3-deoxy-manno-octulosonate cytidylyltransferase [bacterium]|nr:3-deoxy-manno-octulosonate cytidylyltransferase [bacterium]MCP5066734.1 3-deoxy-manno-octulosonate cytidylyltransferase [bacterium]
MSSVRAVGVIPARWASSRFPGKPLVEIAGRPMIQHVVEGARQASRLSRVLVATDDERIARACTAFGAEVAMTSADHPTGSDRLAEVARSLDEEVIVNIQGDEPMIEGFVVDAAVDALLEDSSLPMATVVHAAEDAGLSDPNRVKVVMTNNGDALYFSRSPIPHRRDDTAPRPIWQHVGLYAYRRPFLLEYVHLTPTPLERSEALEQLRALEHGHRIRCAVIDGWQSVPVDTPADVATVEAALADRQERGHGR